MHFAGSQPPDHFDRLFRPEPGTRAAARCRPAANRTSFASLPGWLLSTTCLSVAASFISPEAIGMVGGERKPRETLMSTKGDSTLTEAT